MDRKIHFISGLPRSGSTMLAAILRQNPRFHAAMSSPLCGIFTALRQSLSETEYSLQVTDACRIRLIRAALDEFYSAQTAATIFDTNRGWCGQMAALAQLYPGCRVICCVRSIAWILDSLERQVQGNPFRLSKMFRHDAQALGRTDHGGTMERAEQLLKNQVGVPLDLLRQAWFGDHAGRLIAIRYESIVQEPSRIVGQLYKLLEEEPFLHNFDALEYDEPEFDERLGLPGLHRVRPSVEAVKRETILPPDVFAMHNRSFWEMPGQNPRGVAIL